MRPENGVEARTHARTNKRGTRVGLLYLLVTSMFFTAARTYGRKVGVVVVLCCVGGVIITY